MKILKEKISDVNQRLQKGQEYKDDLLKSKFSEIDQELIKLNPDKLKEEINELEFDNKDLTSQVKNFKLKQPKDFYHEDRHDAIKEVIKSRFAELVTCENKVEEIEDLIQKIW